MSSAAVDQDVVIVGAGISGIGAAYHLSTLCPDRSFSILEGRSDIGGTWSLFRYPGVRSDSDMHTLGYSFKPWTADKSIADGAAIMGYLRETVEEFDIAQHIRFEHLVRRAEWSSETARWTLSVDTPAGPVTMTCSFLFVCAGYYSYRAGHTPDFAGRDDFDGLIVHPQDWPDGLDVTGRRVVVIGSGATAVTLVPALADSGADVTMLQRSPTYMVARPDVDRIALRLRKFLPERVAYWLVRRKNVFQQQFVYRKTRTDPDLIRRRLLDGVRAGLGPGHDIERDYTPSYDPWDQRLCLVPNGDFFAAVRSGGARVVTATIDRFTREGVALADGRELPADVIVTATGLELVNLGEMEVAVDGEEVDFSSTLTYRGVAYSDVPNLVSTFGYVNASWTLRADLVSTYVCRLLNHLRDSGHAQATPRRRPEDDDMTLRPWIDDFSAGYLQRMIPALPKQGDREPWTNPQRYAADRRALLQAPIDDGVMTFSAPRVAVTAES
jgi:cation diffusion facilitator CzcD-associated flavoprotein CzcO